jgi:hypothetical protein
MIRNEVQQSTNRPNGPLNQSKKEWRVVYTSTGQRSAQCIGMIFSYIFREKRTYKGEPVCGSQIDIKSKTCDILTYTCLITPPLRRNPQHRRLLTVVSETFPSPFRPLRHQRNLCHPAVNRFKRQTLPTVNSTNFFVNILCTESFRPQKAHSRTLLFGSVLLKHGHHFYCWNQPLNMRMRLCYLDFREAGLCCYLVIHIENLLRPLQLFYFHLWPTYWLFLVYNLCNSYSFWK